MYDEGGCTHRMKEDIQDTALHLRHVSPVMKKKIAVVTMGVKLGDEIKGYTRFRKIASMLVDAGFEVDLITSSFQHWEKAQRDTTRACYTESPYHVVFIDEPGYKRNLDIRRIRSHHIAARNMSEWFAAHRRDYALIYTEIPPNDVAYACACAAQESQIPFVVDINDLWPEAMRMAFDVPILSSLMFYPFTRDAHRVYQMLSAAVGTSDEYAARPAQDRSEPYPHETVYVGNDLSVFDAGIREHSDEVNKPAGEIWATYTGTLGASYDIETLVRASAQVARICPNFRVKILGDGPDRERLQTVTDQIGAPVDFLGYVEYGCMAAWLSKSDIVVNSLVKGAPQSIVTKIGDYLASGNPVVNTGSSQEFRSKVVHDGFGVNVEAGDSRALARTLERLARNSSLRKIMGAKARSIAEKEFDQSHAYLKIVHLIQTLIA